MIELDLNFLKDGGSIHIKKSHKGRFTEWCHGKVTRECIRRGKASSDPKVRKLATFAENARVWKHQFGGTAIISSFATAKNKALSDAEITNYSKPITDDNTQLKYTSESTPVSSSTHWATTMANDFDLDEPVNKTPAEPIIYHDTKVVTPGQRTKKLTNKFTTSGEAYNKLGDDLKGLITLFEEEGIDANITSGFRLPGVAGKAKNSWHPKGGAIDVSVDESKSSYEDFEKQIVTNPTIMRYLIAHNLGWIREDSPEIMKKTGATGKHIHFGRDNLAKKLRDEAIQKYTPGVSYGLQGMMIKSGFDASNNHTNDLSIVNYTKNQKSPDNTSKSASPKSASSNSNWASDMSSSLDSETTETLSVPVSDDTEKIFSNGSQEQQTVAYLKQLGYPTNFANAFAGIFKAESGLKPGQYNEAEKARNESTAGKGIALWSGSRRTAYDEWMKDKEFNLKNELDFFNHELQTRRPYLYNYIKSNPNASLEDAVDAIYRGYENGSANAFADKFLIIDTYTKAWKKLGYKKIFNYNDSINKRLGYAREIAALQS